MKHNLCLLHLFNCNANTALNYTSGATENVFIPHDNRATMSTAKRKRSTVKMIPKMSPRRKSYRYM